MNIKIRKSYLVIMVLILLSGVFTVTLAYFGVEIAGLDSPETEHFQTGQFDITLTGDSSVQIINLNPIYGDYVSEHGEFNKTFSLTNGSVNVSSNLNVCSRIYLDFDKIDNDLVSEYVRYKIIDETTEVSNIGNFTTANVNNDMLILNNTFIEAGQTKNYRLYIWLEFDDTVSQNNMLNKQLSARLIVKSYDSRTASECGTLADIASGSVQIEGLNKIEQTLTAEITQTKPESNFTYQWYYNNVPTTNGGTIIDGETNNTFTIPAELAGKYIYVTATASLSGFSDKTLSDITDSTNNTSEVVLDTVSPVITMNPNVGATYTKSKTIDVNVYDATGILGNQTFQYGWSTSRTTPPDTYTTISPIYNEGDTNIDFQISSNEELTGRYFLWIKPTNTVCDYVDHLEDNSNNNCNSNIVKSMGVFAFDNTIPTCTISGTYSRGYLNVTITGDDIGSGISDTNGYGFKHDSQTSYTMNDENTYQFSVDVLDNYSIHGYVVDKVGQTNECSNTVTGPVKLAQSIINANKACVDGNNDPIVCRDDEASTYVSATTGVNFAAKSSLSNGQGLYRNFKYGDGSNYYFRGGVVCQYTDYEIETAVGGKCTALGGVWTNHKCSYNKSQSDCTTATFQWNEINNNVMFAGYAWKIIRIEEENGNYYTHLLYNGTETNAYSGDVMITKSMYDTGDGYIDATFVGYMYNTENVINYGNSLDVDDARSNVENSLIKYAIEAWYSGGSTNGTECNGGRCNFSSLATKIITYEDNLANRAFCNDRSLSALTPNGGYAFEDTTYAGYDRTYNTRIPTFGCSLAGDTFTLSSTAPGIKGTASYGNNKLTYPIGLITADELVYAGSIKSTPNYNTYVQAGGVNGLYWSMTPGTMTADGSNSISMAATGALVNQSTSTQKGIRPVIVLEDAVFSSSGDGSMASPYVVE